MQGYIEQGIPLDAQWVDIEYKQDFKDFTFASVDPLGKPGPFKDLPDYVKQLH